MRHFEIGWMQLTMNVLGKIFGLAVGGLLMRHPLAMVTGLVVGHLFDSGVLRNDGSTAPPRAGFLGPLFGLMGALAKADGRVSEAEITCVEACMHRMQLEQSERHLVIEAFNRGKQQGYDLDRAARELHAFIQFQPDLKAAVGEMLMQLLQADGALPNASAVNHTARRVFAQLGLNDDAFETLRARTHAHRSRTHRAHEGAGQRQHGRAHERTQDARGRTRIADPYAVLGVSANASDSEVRRAYRRLITQHHPDKLPPDASAAKRQEAEQHAREINAAYEQIQSWRKLRR